MIEGPDQIPLIHKQDNISVADQYMAVLGKPMSRRDDMRYGDIWESVRHRQGFTIPRRGLYCPCICTQRFDKPAGEHQPDLYEGGDI